MREEGNMLLNNVNIRKEFLPIQKCAFRQQAFPNLIIYTSWKLSTAIKLNKVGSLMSALSLIEINMCCTAIP